MDSLTQIVLGASVAEATLGKKIGNKAIILGAIAGTTAYFDNMYSRNVQNCCLNCDKQFHWEANN